MPSFRPCSFSSFTSFLDAPSHLSKSLCPSDGPSVRNPLSQIHARRIFCRVSGVAVFSQKVLLHRIHCLLFFLFVFFSSTVFYVASAFILAHVIVTHKNQNCIFSVFSSGRLIFSGYFETGAALDELADNSACLLMYSSHKDQLIPFSRQQRLFKSFAARSKKNCSIFNENQFQVHDRSPWVDAPFPKNLKKFLVQ